MDWSMHWPCGLTAEAKLLGVSAYPESAPHFTPPRRTSVFPFYRCHPTSDSLLVCTYTTCPSYTELINDTIVTFPVIPAVLKSMRTSTVFELIVSIP